MDERAFIERKRPEWDRLTALVDRAASFGGLRSLTGQELADLGKLYRRITSDLAYAKAKSANEDLIIHLNELAGRAHGYLYVDAPKSGLRSTVSFLLRGFPILFRRKWRYIALAAAIMLCAAVFSGIIVAQSPDAASHFMPYGYGRGHPEKGSGPPEKYEGTDTPASFSSRVMTNNIRVSFLSFAGGITFGLLTVYMLITNGLMLGAFVMQPPPFLHSRAAVAAFILPHGIIELTAIAISAGAGLIMGWALFVPGSLTRWDSLRKSSKDALPLVGGVVAMLIVAGCIEGFIARSTLPYSIQLTVAALTGIGLIAYFGWAGRSEDVP